MGDSGYPHGYSPRAHTLSRARHTIHKYSPLSHSLSLHYTLSLTTPPRLWQTILRIAAILLRLRVEWQSQSFQSLTLL